jgi:hypothetical protein
MYLISKVGIGTSLSRTIGNNGLSLQCRHRRGQQEQTAHDPGWHAESFCSIRPDSV